MSNVVAFKLINGTDVIGTLNTEPSVLAEYAHIPNPVVLDDALVIMARVVSDANNENPRIQVSFEPLAYAIEGQGPARVAFAGATVLQFPVDTAYSEGYQRTVSPIALPPGGGGKIIL